jgi:hypothetical protein
VTISRSAGDDDLLCNSGENKDQGIWPRIGFDTGEDRTGGGPHEGDEVLYVADDVDRVHLLRVDGEGYKDDASGTYTGTPGALITLGPDVARALLLSWMGKASDIVDESFEAARTAAPQPLGIYLSRPASTKEIFDQVERSCDAQIVVEGDGRVSFTVYSSDVPSDAVHLEDHDYLSFEQAESDTDVYSTVRVYYDEDPSTGDWRHRLATSASTPARFQRPEPKDFHTYLTDQDDAQRGANLKRTLGAAPRWRFTFAVKGRLMDHKVGDKVLLSRSRGLGGPLVAHAVRLLTLRQRPQGGRTTAHAVTNVVV